MVEDLGDNRTGTPGGSQPGDYSAPGIERNEPRQPGGVGPPAAAANPTGNGLPAGPGAGEQDAGRNATPPPPRPAPPQQAATGPAVQSSIAGGPPPTRMPPASRKAGGGGTGKTLLIAIVGAVIGALIVLVVMPWGFGVNPWDLVRGRVQKVEKEEKIPKGTAVVVSPTQGAVDVADIARKVTPSIVNIDIRTAPQRTSGPTPQAVEGTGSGVIYTTDGYILTNNHVVQNAQQITVTLASGQQFPGTSVGTDPTNDIAVVKINKAGLPTIHVGNSDSLVVGQLAVAVGSPFGFEQSVTAGIISALHRVVSASGGAAGGSETLTNLIQTDAAVNPGNSGGALCDSDANLIGINTLIASASGGFEGVSFAIPINTAVTVAEDIIAGRPVSHPYVGILGQTVSATVAKQYNLPSASGAYVTQVVPGGPADKAGIKNGDIIVSINGKVMNSMDDVIGAVRQHTIGDKLSVTFYEGKNKKTTTITVEDTPKG